MPVTTTRLLIACTEAVRAQMNATLGQIDPSSSGDVMTAEIALSAAPDVTVGRWTSWAMTSDDRSAILRAYAQQGWRPLRGSEGRPHVSGDRVPAWGTQRFWMFDAAYYGPKDVLSALGAVPRNYDQ